MSLLNANRKRPSTPIPKTGQPETDEAFREVDRRLTEAETTVSSSTGSGAAGVAPSRPLGT